MAMSSAFLRASCTELSINKKSGEMQCLSKLFQVLVKLISKPFLK